MPRRALACIWAPLATPLGPSHTAGVDVPTLDSVSPLSVFAAPVGFRVQLWVLTQPSRL